VADLHARPYCTDTSPIPAGAGDPWESAIRCSQSLATPNARVGALLASGFDQLRLWHRLKFAKPTTSPGRL
jgi:hypothetical protein